jgi:hypothetical protein
VSQQARNPGNPGNPSNPGKSDSPGEVGNPGRVGSTGRSDRARGEPPGRAVLKWHPANLLLLIPLLGTLIPVFYNRVTPRLGGMPFFYWYQLVWIPISVGLTLLVYRATRGDR